MTVFATAVAEGCEGYSQAVKRREDIRRGADALVRKWR